MARRYRYAFAKKREASKGKWSVGLAAASLVLFIAAVVLALFFDGKLGGLIGGTGLFAMLLSAYGFTLGLSSFSEENRKHFSDMQEVWIAASDEADEQHFDKERAYQLFLEHTENLVQPSAKRKTLTISPWMYAAAMVVIVFFCGTIAFQSGKRVLRNQLTQITVEAPYGSKTKLYLPDGTLVWLNADSRMSYAQDFGINERSLNLSGEAYFEVTRNEEIPFKVHTEELDVKVLGTKFNFRNYKDDLEAKVCLLEGKVALNTRQKETVLHPDQQALLDKKTGKLSVSGTKAAYSAEWTNDRLYFDEVLLSDIIKELERSYDVKITVAPC